MHSDLVSRKRPFSTDTFCVWILVDFLLTVSRIAFEVLIVFWEPFGARDC